MIQYQSSCSKLLLTSLSTFPASRMSGSGISNPHLGGMSKGRSKLWYLERDPPKCLQLCLIFNNLSCSFGIIWDPNFGSAMECLILTSAHENLHPTPSDAISQVAHQVCKSPARGGQDNLPWILVVTSHATRLPPVPVHCMDLSKNMAETQSYYEHTTAMESNTKTSKIKINRFIVNHPDLQVR